MASNNEDGDREQRGLSPWTQMEQNHMVKRTWLNRTIFHPEEDTSSSEEEEEPEEYFSDGEQVSIDEKYTSEGNEKSVAEAGEPVLGLREYQKELSTKALEGSNTIICAPTGSGKTRVATHIIMEHLKREDGRTKKVAFLARTVPLAIQQYKSLCKYLPKYTITHITGQSENTMSLHFLLPHNDVVVMTPMILENHIKQKLLPHLGVFTMLVFDECHHTREGEPYNTLMYTYLKIKASKAAGERDFEDVQLPQIIGLTASIGVEKAVALPNAVNSILKVCGNLDVYQMSTVERNVHELRQTVPVPCEKFVQLREREDNETVDKINQIMQKLELHLQHHAEELNNDTLKKLARTRPLNRKSQEYGQWAVEVKKKARVVPIHDGDRETNMSVRSQIIIAEYLVVYNVALETHDLVVLKDVMSYLEKCFRRFQLNEQRTTGENIYFGYFEELQSLVLRRHGEENQNLTLLAEVLLEYLTEEGTRGIIFVRTRALAEALASWLNRCDFATLRALKASSFTGTNATEEQGGMSQAQQEAIIQQFRSGEVRLLVATSVAEEGLDIPQCNLVVKYNHVGNEITSVQTRGRSRAFGGVSVLLAMGDILRREQINQGKAQLMEKAIAHIQNMPPQEVKTKVEEHQHNAIEEGRIAELAAQMKRMRLRDVPFRVVCPLCRKVAVDHTNMRTIFEKYRVSIDRNLLDNIDFIPRREPEKMDQLLFVGKVFCKGEPEPGKRCNHDLGVMISHHKIPFVAIGIKNFGFDTGDGGPLTTYKQWKKVPYVIEELSYYDIKKYQQGLDWLRNHDGNGEEDNDDDSSSDSDDSDDDIMKSIGIQSAKSSIRKTQKENDLSKKDELDEEAGDDTQVKRVYATDSTDRKVMMQGAEARTRREAELNIPVADNLSRSASHTHGGRAEMFRGSSDHSSLPMGSGVSRMAGSVSSTQAMHNALDNLDLNSNVTPFREPRMESSIGTLQMSESSGTSRGSTFSNVL